ncbi:MAG: hypothetical protein J5U17_06870 [Candidatus Methanoperedens sp.]|nr:hypothetical protein [Candidatus Methanoperedens sp.]MCE8425485.1 hypothetical protein [Candidatus Methanoperedens sp.]MCE8427947.1 hypothetical protein [Candidatus Methanoperedens sp.]
MRLTDVLLLAAALIVAYFIVGFLMAVTFFLLKIAVILAVAGVIYLFFKKII